MDNEFYTLLTDRGMAKIASALADKKQLHLQKMAVGDGGGQYYEPIASQTKLRHEVWRGEMNTLTVAPNNPNWLIAELVLPEDVGGWYVREVGVFDDEGERSPSANSLSRTNRCCRAAVASRFVSA